MHSFFYYIGFFIVLGAVGMSVANKRVEKKVRSERWKKFVAYILIIGFVLVFISADYFWAIAIVISVISTFEFVKASWPQFSKRRHTTLSFLLFFSIVAGFILFSRTFNSSFLLFIYFQVFIFDAFCQITGQLLGKHALIPSISPSKTVEGMLGGWFFCIVAALVGLTWMKLSFITGLLLGLITGLTSFTGDVLASYYKRKLGIKDYSNWLPGQGGFLDRFDSFLFTGFVYYVLYVLFLRTNIMSLPII